MRESLPTQPTSVRICFYDKSQSLRDRVKVRFYKARPNSPENPGFILEILPFSPDKALGSLVKEYKLDAIVSPGNSFGWLAGGFDAVIAQYYATATFRLKQEIQKGLQKILVRDTAGYNPPGSALIVDMNDALEYHSLSPEPYLIHLPTMAMPTVIKQGEHLIFDCMWNLLVAIDKHNSNSPRRIQNVLLTGLGTGTGNVSDDVCAKGIVEALDYYVNRLHVSDDSISYAQATKFTKDNLGYDK